MALKRLTQTRGEDGRPLLFKQVMAVIDSRTTDICLDAAGQTQQVDDPFVTLNGRFDHPPFHINCRDWVIPWMEGFDTGVEDRAAGERRKRPVSRLVKKRKLPPPVDDNRPVDARGRMIRRKDGPKDQVGSKPRTEPVDPVELANEILKLTGLAKGWQRRALEKLLVLDMDRDDRLVAITRVMFADLKKDLPSWLNRVLAGGQPRAPKQAAKARDVGSLRKAYEDLDPRVEYTAAEKQAIRDYSLSGAAVLNGVLRRGQVDKLGDQFNNRTLGELRDTLDAALGKTRLPEATTVFRGAGPSVVNNLTVGAVFHDDGFVSTTINPEKARFFQVDPSARRLMFEVPAGFRVLFADRGQMEIVLPRNLTFKVVSIDEDFVRVVIL